MPEADTEGRQAPRGRALGYAVFGLAVGGLTAVFSVQILLQVFAPEGAEVSVECPQALRGMWHALSRARQSAAEQSDEQAGISAFRTGLLPEWRLLPALRAGCGSKPPYHEATTALVRLRYLEERAVRSESGTLVRERDDVERLLSALDGPRRSHAGPAGADLGPTP